MLRASLGRGTYYRNSKGTTSSLYRAGRLLFAQVRFARARQQRHRGMVPCWGPIGKLGKRPPPADSSLGHRADRRWPDLGG
jgi:hypothetical protein